MRGVGWISACVCLKSDGTVFHFISFYLIAILVSLSTHVVLARGVGNLVPAARGALHCTRAREGDLVLTRGVLLGILDLAAKLAGLTFEMPAEPVGVLLALTVRPRVLAVDLRCACQWIGRIERTNPRTNLP